MEQREIDCYLPDAGANSAAAPPHEAAQEALARVVEGQPLSESQWAALPRNNKKMIERAAFVYDERKDEYRCPAGQSLVFLRVSKDKKKWGTSERRQYGGCSACASCVHAKLCCKDPRKGRVVSRDQYEAHRRRLRRRMDTQAGRAIYKRRKCTVEPCFGAHQAQHGRAAIYEAWHREGEDRMEHGLHGGQSGNSAASLE